MSAITSTSQVTSSQNTQSSSSKALPTGTTGIANESTFLTLLVSQLKNQDPMSPTDGTQFVTQLAQFSSLEQLTNINTNVGSITKTIDPNAATATQTSGVSGS
jgi:flagellar basal-body rod modification protein FlgD